MSDPDRTASLMSPAKLVRQPNAGASPAAGGRWLDHMAADAGHLHVEHLAQQHMVLAPQARPHAMSGLRADLQALERALGAIDFSLLQSQGWLARARGKEKDAVSEFSGQVQAAQTALAAVAGHAQTLQQRATAQAQAIERAMLDLAVEFQALDKIVDQGARWLADMQSQLKARHADASDEAARAAVKADAARCETLVRRLKVLRGVGGAARQAHEQFRAAAASRAALVATLEQVQAQEGKAWQARIAPLVAEGKPGALSLEGPTEAQQALLARLAQAAAGAQHLAAQEESLAADVARLGQQLQAAQAG